jgi:hypothetical protein
MSMFADALDQPFPTSAKNTVLGGKRAIGHLQCDGILLALAKGEHLLDPTTLQTAGLIERTLWAYFFHPTCGYWHITALHFAHAKPTFEEVQHSIRIEPIMLDRMVRSQQLEYGLQPQFRFIDRFL